MSDAAIKQLADSIMRAVVNTGAVTNTAAGIDKAIAVMRAELMAFLTGDEWRNERECVVAGTVSQTTVLASLVASIVIKIKAAA